MFDRKFFNLVFQVDGRAERAVITTAPHERNREGTRNVEDACGISTVSLNNGLCYVNTIGDRRTSDAEIGNDRRQSEDFTVETPACERSFFSRREGFPIRTSSRLSPSNKLVVSSTWRDSSAFGLLLFCQRRKIHSDAPLSNILVTVAPFSARLRRRRRTLFINRLC